MGPCRSILPLACLLTGLPYTGIAFAQDSTPPKIPCAQVLSMPVGKWVHYYVKRKGVEETELADREALYLYADCLKKRNDSALSRLPQPTSVRLQAYETLIGKFHEDALLLRMHYNGGGTIFLDFFADARVADAQFTARLIPIAARETSKPRTGGNAALIARIQRTLRENSPDSPAMRDAVREVTAGDPPGVTVRVLREDFARLQDTLRRLTARLPADRPREAQAVLDYAAHVKTWLAPLE